MQSRVSDPARSQSRQNTLLFHPPTYLSAHTHTYIPVYRQLPTYPPTHVLDPPTYIITHLLIYPPARVIYVSKNLPTYLPSYPLTHSPAYLPTELPTCWLAYLLAYVLTHPPNHPRTWAPTCLPTYLLAYLPN